MSRAPGLHLCKLDLHTHTPASRCYEQREHTPEQIVQAALAQGLDGIAVTDHNSAAWIDRMRAAAAGTPLAVFPGVEISTHEGYHVVALFDVSAGQADVENFLGAIGIAAQDYGRSDVLCEKSVYEVLELIHKRDGLAVLAHIDAPKGAFYELAAVQAGQVRVQAACVRLFNDLRYDAVEVVNDDLPPGFDPVHQIWRRHAFYQASDNPDPDNPIHHSAAGLAQRCTWFNLDEIRLEGLRQCFADPEVRIHLREAQQVRTWPHILRMSVGPQGFLAHQQFRFHPGLSSIIGGKGVGKSLAIEFLRFGLDQPSEHADIYRDYVGKLDARLGALNQIEVEFRLANGTRYRLERTYQARGEGELTCTNLDTGEPYTGSIRQLFPLLAYSQTEVIKIAESEGAQLRLLDSLIDARPYQRAISEVQEELERNDRQVAEGMDARVKVEDLREQVATLAEEIANVDNLLSSPLLREMKEAEAKKEVLEGQSAYLDRLRAQSVGYLAEVEEQEPPPLPEGLKEDPLLGAQLERARATRQALVEALHVVACRIDAALQAVGDAWSGWRPVFEATQARYEAELRGRDQAGLEMRRRQLEGQRNKAEQDLERYRKLAEEVLQGLLAQRRALLDRLDMHHQEYFQARKAKFDHLTIASDGRLQLSLTHATNRGEYARALVELLRGQAAATISTAQRGQIASRVCPRELGEIILARDVAALARAAGLSVQTAERALNKLWAHDDLAEVLALQHAYYPADTPSIRFNKGNDQFAELGELSVGQKSTALLIVALCDGDMPVIIDQPEDALDIASVWEDIAKKLRRGKSGRQFILTTHNSSLAVGSDSDQFMVLTPLSSERAKVSYRGAIDREDVRQAVIAHLEGGDEPYKLRQRKYNIKHG